MTDWDRRSFLRSAASGGSAAMLTSGASAQSSSGNYAVEDQAPFNGQTRRLKFTKGDRYIGALIFSSDYPTHYRLKPEIFPVCTPMGIPVTGSHEYCFIHHQSVMCGHGKIRVGDRDKPYDLYRKLPFPQEERADQWHRDFNLFHLGPSGIQRITRADWAADSGGITVELELEWQTREFNRDQGETLLRETRRYRISQQGRYTIIDHRTHLETAGEHESATLLADRHSFCGVRLNDLIDVEDGGSLLDSEGRKNGSGNFWDSEGERKAPKWVDGSGQIGQNTVGMALMGHPSNLRNQFYYREFGLIEVSPALGEDVEISRESPFRFSARYVAHDGPLTPEEADRLYEDYAESDPFL